MRLFSLLAALVLLPLAGCDTHGIDTESPNPLATVPGGATSDDPDKPDCDKKPEDPKCKP